MTQSHESPVNPGWFTPLNDSISIKKDQIAALKEYKTSLINAAVTGKIKVAPDEVGVTTEHALGDHA